jgi:hypothetical protein
MRSNTKKISVFAGLLGGAVLLTLIMPPKTHSLENVPYPQATTCRQSIENERFLMDAAWQSYLDTLETQEKPASEMVDEAYESLRTYRCWLDYLCLSARFSAGADEVNAPKVGNGPEAFSPIIDSQIGTISGCAAPEDIRYGDRALRVLDNCKANTSEAREIVAIGATNYESCRELVFRDFYSAEGANADSPAFTRLERKLKQVSADQKNRVLTRKLASIGGKLKGLEANLNRLSSQVGKVYSKLPCLVAKCD